MSDCRQNCLGTWPAKLRYIVFASSQLVGSQPFTCDAASEPSQRQTNHAASARDLAHGTDLEHTSILRNCQIGLFIRRPPAGYYVRHLSARSVIFWIYVYALADDIKRSFSLKIETRLLTNLGFYLASTPNLNLYRKYHVISKLPRIKWTRKISPHLFLLASSSC